MCVDPRLLGVHGAHGDGALPGGARPLALARGDRPRRGVGRRVGPGRRELAGRAPRQGDRADAVGVGDRLHPRRAAGVGDPPEPRLAGAVRRRGAARAAGLVGPSQRAGAGDLAARAARRRLPFARRLPAAAPAQRRRRDDAHLERAVRVLGAVHLGPGVPRRARRRPWRGHEHRAVIGLDHPDAGGGVPRLRAVRRAGGPFGRRPGSWCSWSARPFLCPSTADGGEAGRADGARTVDRLLRARLLQRLRRDAGRAVPIGDPRHGAGVLLQLRPRAVARPRPRLSACSPRASASGPRFFLLAAAFLGWPRCSRSSCPRPRAAQLE